MIQSFPTSIDEDEAELEMFEADEQALDNITIGKSLAEAQELGVVVTPKQYQCSYCSAGSCNVVANNVQCSCGTYQCPPTGPSMQYYHSYSFSFENFYYCIF